MLHDNHFLFLECLTVNAPSVAIAGNEATVAECVVVSKAIIEIKKHLDLSWSRCFFVFVESLLIRVQTYRVL